MSKPTSDQTKVILEDTKKPNDPFESLSPEYKKKWEYILKTHPWIIKEEDSLKTDI